MKIVFLTPTHQSTARGNTVTVQRWTAGLRKRGHTVTILENSESEQVPSLAPDIIHAHHAVHCGPTALALKNRIKDARLVISLGGTDLHGPQGSPQEQGRQALASADAIVGPFAQDGQKLEAAFPECDNFHVVPRGVFLPPPEFHPFHRPLRGVVVGGIRQVKGQLEAIAWQEQARTEGLHFTLTIAGPVIDQKYGEKVQQAVEAQDDTRVLGALSPRATQELIRQCDFLLNSSENEGASNAILEALALGRCVAARRNPGNTGLLESAPEDFAHLIDPTPQGLKTWFSWLKGLSHRDPQQLGNKARKYASHHYGLEREMNALLEVYENVLC